ncbi:MAG: energy transducer TonB, partial [Terricaulis sp.]
SDPSWIRRPNGADYERFWPTRAREREMEGVASLDCLVDAEGRLACTVTSEDPPNMGFGEAAVRISRQFRMNPQTVNGQPTAGGRYRLRIPFRFGRE